MLDSFSSIASLVSCLVCLIAIPFAYPYLLRRVRFVQRLKPIKVKIISSSPKKEGRFYEAEIVFEYEHGGNSLQSSSVGYSGSPMTQNYTNEGDAARVCSKYKTGAESDGLIDEDTNRIFLESNWGHKTDKLFNYLILILFPVIWFLAIGGVITFLFSLSSAL